MLLIALCSVFGFAAQKKQKVIQVNVSAVLNARPVTVLNHGKLFTWTKGIDGNGAGDGYLTMSAALFNGDKTPHALPDEPVYKANAFHPEIILHYSNNDTSGNQARSVSGEDSFTLKMPAHKYSALYICLTSAEGPSRLMFQLVYTGGVEAKEIVLPDYYNDVAQTTPEIVYVAHDLAKWGNKNNMTETDHHNIDAAVIHPDEKRVLTAIKIIKGKAGYLVFWGAAGTTAE